MGGITSVVLDPSIAISLALDRFSRGHSLQALMGQMSYTKEIISPMTDCAKVTVPVALTMVFGKTIDHDRKSIKTGCLQVMVHAYMLILWIQFC